MAQYSALQRSWVTVRVVSERFASVFLKKGKEVVSSYCPCSSSWNGGLLVKIHVLTSSSSLYSGSKWKEGAGVGMRRENSLQKPFAASQVVLLGEDPMVCFGWLLLVFSTCQITRESAFSKNTAIMLLRQKKWRPKKRAKHNFQKKMFTATRVKRVIYDEGDVELGCFRLYNSKKHIWCVSLPCLEDLLVEDTKEINKEREKLRYDYSLPTPVRGSKKGQMVPVLQKAINSEPFQTSERLMTTDKTFYYWLTLAGLDWFIRLARANRFKFISRVDEGKLANVRKLMMMKERPKLTVLTTFHPRANKESLLARAQRMNSDVFDFQVFTIIFKLAGLSKSKSK